MKRILCYGDSSEKEFDELRKSGAITEKEYKKMKDKIIQDL